MSDMRVKAKVTKPVKAELKELEITLDAADAYWLLGVIGAQTDETARRLYNDLLNTFQSETGERAVDLNKRDDYGAASRMANHNRLYGGVANLEDAPKVKIITFNYDGHSRRVTDPFIDGQLLKGFETHRGIVETNQYKSYRLDRIGKTRSPFPLRTYDSGLWR
jgi:hypothetical protein